jgi:hypothetical protein
MQQPATYIVRPETLLATEVVDSRSTSPSTIVTTLATLVACRRRQTKLRHSRKHVTRCSIDWKLVDSVFEPLHARFDLTLEGCADDEGLNSHGGLPHCSPSDSILERDLSAKRVSLIHPVSWLNRLDSSLKVVVGQLQHLQWLFLYYQMGKVQPAL